jgi:hypothetical protein
VPLTTQRYLARLRTHPESRWLLALVRRNRYLRLPRSRGPIRSGTTCGFCVHQPPRTRGLRRTPLPARARESGLVHESPTDHLRGMAAMGTAASGENQTDESGLNGRRPASLACGEGSFRQILSTSRVRLVIGARASALLSVVPCVPLPLPSCPSASPPDSERVPKLDRGERESAGRGRL